MRATARRLTLVHVHRKSRVPAIGITSGLRKGDLPAADSEVMRHIRLVRRLGASPVLLHSDDDVAKIIRTNRVLGIIVSGGIDIDPAVYGGRRELCEPPFDPRRDHTECEAIEAALNNGMAVLCVCRGLQLANVVLGGSLMEDISTELGARYTIPHHQIRELGLPRAEYSHSIRMLPDSNLRRIVRRDRIRVNSTHHQAIRQIAKGLSIAALSDDGLIEAIEGELERGFLIGVQWHPEALPAVDRSSRAIYQAFIQASAQRGAAQQCVSLK